MLSVEEIDFGPDTDAIRRWLAQRETYVGEAGDPVGHGERRIELPITVEPGEPTVSDARRDVVEAPAPERVRVGLAAEPKRKVTPKRAKRKVRPKHRRKTFLIAALARVGLGRALSLA
jgi:hypothetical protein